MFSGIVEGLGTIKDIEEREDFKVLSISIDKFGRGVRVGDSIAVNGACLTVTKKRFGIVRFDIMKETLDKTDLGDLKIGDKVNIERSLKLGDRIDGHIVLGHIDGVAIIEDKIIEGDNVAMRFSLPNNLQYGLVPKGSIGIDGISLTIADIKDNKFSVGLIPHTLEITTLGLKKAGDKVNIEIDYVGKWIRKLVD